ncbi:MAG TPA: exo-beta-N-acetylmuramidase NamZ domain-containing protein, partial [Planctomycetota bacterium]|nr:exo-beta-N-acetylmuramidase NamZ domain-containing protein [Planctomycetota bacterium]
MRRTLAAFGIVLALAACVREIQPSSAGSADAMAGAQRPRVTLGIEALLADGEPLLAGKRLGLVTNPSGVDSARVATADLLARDPRWKLVQLFSPEHGVRGDAAAGDVVASSTDAATGLPVESLYGNSKQPSAEALARVDAVLFDIQDVGSRTYTYIST